MENVPPPLAPFAPPPPPIPLADVPAGPRRPRWRSAVFLLIVGLYPLLIGVLGHFLGGGQPSTGPALPPDVRGLLLVSLENFGLFALLFAAGWFFGRPRPADLFIRPMRWWDWLWGALWSVGVRVGVAVALFAVLLPFIMVKMARSGTTDPEASRQVETMMQQYRPKVEALVDFQALTHPLYLLVACTLLSFVTAGLREELWRAGFISSVQDLLPDSWRRAGAPRPGESAVSAGWRRLLLHVPAVLLASVIFGLGHVIQGPGAVVMTGVVGLILGLVMVGHRSLWTAVIAHGFFDATTFVLLGLLVRYHDVLEKFQPGITKQIGL
jgi:membrane protease YdiL (CAAX protease family)